MSQDRQIARLADARRWHHEATQTHREAVEELARAGAELTTAASALAERVRLLDTTRRADARRVA